MSRTRLILLGTAGGSATFPLDGSPTVARQGIASALVVDGQVHLVDAGQGVARQLTFADIGGHGPAGAFSGLRGIYLTHLHSDHTMDLANLVHCGFLQGWPQDVPVDVWGPGSRGPLAAVPTPGNPVVRPSEPTPGTSTFVRHLLEAFATDLNDRILAAGRRNPFALLRSHDLLPPVPVDLDRGTCPTVDPWLVMQDDTVRVTATLVEHGAMFPCLAYRFDTADGSVVFSGDTVPSENLVRLASGADVLVHEVIDARYGSWQFGPGPLGPAQERAVATVLGKHTSTDQVGAVAQAAGVGTLVLTHLVPASLPTEHWESLVTGFDGRVVVGEDLLELDLAPR
ncbi:MBL fold metallo-hydrolase [Actinotalea sp.]|uniref:MBL fold metallo-hydrolase n=1 Tax=Actinotalea sp. TaxID=1872145 RepID=UPI003561AB2A